MANHHFDDLPDKTSLHVFKDDIQPMWEDPKNISGGHFKLTTRMQETTEKLWLEVVSNFLKDQFPHRDLLVCPSVPCHRARKLVDLLVWDPWIRCMKNSMLVPEALCELAFSTPCGTWSLVPRWGGYCAG